VRQQETVQAAAQQRQKCVSKSILNLGHTNHKLEFPLYSSSSSTGGGGGGGGAVTHAIIF
jgi:hypothetical protein